ncbi:glycosyltransferase family 4 protein [Candidatus Gracilibacteria bacterium]|nr:glycosyltransferase family 4 protein [Candidatus Gracilibacteria bacterium]
MPYRVRVLLATPDLGLSGAPLILADLAEGLRAAGYAVTVTSTGRGPLAARLERAGVVVHTSTDVLGDATVGFALVRDYDILIANTVQCKRLIHAARAVGKPAIWWLHESGFGRRMIENEPIAASALQAAAALVFPARATADLYADLVSPGRAHHVYYGIAPLATSADAPFAPPVGKFSVLCLGSVEARKGQDVLLRALESLADDVRDRVEVYCLGSVLEPAYFQQIAPRAGAGNLHFLGSVPHEQALAALRSCDIFVLPSRDEVLPIALLEAMAAGRAIATTRVGGIPEAIRHEQEGLLFNSGDFRTLAAQLTQLAQDEELRQRLGGAAAQRHAEHFSAARFISEMEGVIKQVLGALGCAQSSKHRFVMNLLIISHDVIGSRMAGPGIRYWELARVLARAHRVTLLAPQPIDAPPPGVRCGAFAIGSFGALKPWLADADAVLANGAVLQFHSELAAGPPLLLDLYDPTALEHLELFRDETPVRRTEQHANDVALLQAQLRAGNAFICATERQRDLYIGALMAVGRLTPSLTDADPTLRALIDVVPFGLPEVAAQHGAPALRGVLPGIAEGELLILWTGGLWDWMDPQTLIAAMPSVVAALPQTRLVFLAGRHPGNIGADAHAGRSARAGRRSGLAGQPYLFLRRLGALRAPRRFFARIRSAGIIAPARAGKRLCGGALALSGSSLGRAR